MFLLSNTASAHNTSSNKDMNKEWRKQKHEQKKQSKQGKARQDLRKQAAGGRCDEREKPMEISRETLMTNEI